VTTRKEAAGVGAVSMLAQFCFLTQCRLPAQSRRYVTEPYLLRSCSEKNDKTNHGNLNLGGIGVGLLEVDEMMVHVELCNEWLG
jgi:hypothetical protein